jgi:transposase InsO family protein
MGQRWPLSSMSRKGNYWGNTLAERFFRNLKQEGGNGVIIKRNKTKFITLQSGTKTSGNIHM